MTSAEAPEVETPAASADDDTKPDMDAPTVAAPAALAVKPKTLAEDAAATDDPTAEPADD